MDVGRDDRGWTSDVEGLGSVDTGRDLESVHSSTGGTDGLPLSGAVLTVESLNVVVTTVVAGCTPKGNGPWWEWGVGSWCGRHGRVRKDSDE